MNINYIIQNYWPVICIGYTIYEAIVGYRFRSSVDVPIKKQLSTYPKSFKDLSGQGTHKKYYFCYSQLSSRHLKLIQNYYETRLNKNYVILTLTDLIIKIAFPVLTFFFVTMITVSNNFMQSAFSVAKEVKDEIVKFEKLTSILENMKENTINYIDAMPTVLAWFAVIFLLPFIHTVLLNHRKNMYQSRINVIKLVLEDKKEIGDRPLFNTNQSLEKDEDFENAIFHLIPVCVWDQDKVIHTGIVKSHTEQDVYVDNERYSKSIYQFKTK